MYKYRFGSKLSHTSVFTLLQSLYIPPPRLVNQYEARGAAVIDLSSRSASLRGLPLLALG